MQIFAKKHEIRPRPRIVHGIEIKKLPTLAYVKVMERTGGLFLELLGLVFPGKTPGAVIGYLASVDSQQFKELLAKLFSHAPFKLLQVLREIVGAQENPIWDDLTPAEHMRVVKAFWEMNDLTDFLKSAQSLASKILARKDMTDQDGLSDS